MKSEFDFKNASVLKGPLFDPKKTKVQTSIRLDGDVMPWLQKTAHEQSIPYQTFINRVFPLFLDLNPDVFAVGADFT
ncbi:MAG: hypothetical protein C5B49_07255, partial [Bdellovibrio sp.]